MLIVKDTKTFQVQLKRDFRLKERPREAQASCEPANDCTVRAFSNATGIDYWTSHEFIRNLGRKCGMGFFMEDILVCVKHTSFCQSVKSERKGMLGKRLSSWLVNEKPRGGRWIVRVDYRGTNKERIGSHVFAIIDGKVYDNAKTPNAEVTGLWKIES